MRVPERSNTCTKKYQIFPTNICSHANYFYLKITADKDDSPKFFDALKCVGGKAKKAVADALKKAGKAKVVVSKNFMKRGNGTDADSNSTAIDIPKIVIPTLNFTSALSDLVAKIGLPGKPASVTDPSSDKPCGDPINPLQALRSEIAERLAKRN